MLVPDGSQMNVYPSSCYPTEHGAKVTAHFNTNISPLRDLIEVVGSASVRAIQADLTNESSVSQMFSQHEDQPDFGPVQIVVINHGIWPTADAPIAAMSLDRWNHTIDTNLTSSFLVAREYLRQLSLAPGELKANANIVFIGSTAGKYGEAGHADYAATKSGECCVHVSFDEMAERGLRGRSYDVRPDYVAQERDREDRTQRKGKLYSAWLGQDAHGRGNSPRYGVCPTCARYVRHSASR